MATTNKNSPHFNGIIRTDEGDVKVVNGMGKIGGDTFYLSDDGLLVVDTKQRVVAVVINGKATQLTPELIEQLKAAGLVK